MSVNLSPLGGAGWQFLDNSGNVLSGGLLYTYSAGTTTPLTTYQDATGTTANSNPVVLDAAGRVSGEVWLTAGLNYKLVLKTSTGTTLWTADNISGGTDAAASVLAQLAASGGSSLIGFLQSGTGAVATTVQSKLRETVSVKDFGAVGDGVTDDTAAIQAALTSLSQNAELVFPAGSYKVSDQVVCAVSGISVVGHGAKITQTGANKVTLRFNSVSRISVSGLWFEGKGTEHVGAGTSWNGVAAVYFDTCTNVAISDCYMTNHAGGSIRWGGSADGFRFVRNKIVGIGSAGGIVAGDNNSDFAISGYSSLADNNVVISANDISGHCFGVGLARGSNCAVTGNVIHDIPGQHGLYLSQQSGTSVVGNTLLNIAYEGIKNQISTASAIAVDLVISNNVIRDAGQSGIVIGATALATGALFQRVVVSNNVINSPGNYGVVFESVDDAVVSGNVISDTGGYGIYWNEGSGDISGNFIRNANWNGMLLELSKDTTVRGNTIIDAVLNAEAGTSQARYLYYVNVSKGSTAASDPKLFFSGNTLSLVGTAPTHFNASGKCLRANTGVLVYWDKNTNLTTKAWQFNTAGELKQIDIGYSPSVAFTATANQNPTTPVYGRGRRELYGTQDPATAGMTDAFIAGDVCWKSNAVAGGTPGWICTTAGTPGTWKAMANLAP